MHYRNRILELRHLPAAELLDNPANWRTHPQAQRQALQGILQEVGIAGTLTAYHSQRNGGRLTLLDGHLRKETVGETLPVVVLDIDDAEADKLLAVFDPLSAMAGQDDEKLKALLESVETESEDLQALLETLNRSLSEEEWNPQKEATAPPEFKEVGEQLETEYCCPKCGYQWSGKPK